MYYVFLRMEIRMQLRFNTKMKQHALPLFKQQLKKRSPPPSDNVKYCIQGL